MRFIRLATVTACALGASVAIAASPAAASPNTTCNSGRFCLYENNDFNRGNTDHWLDLTADDYDLRNNYWTGSNDSIDNETSSIKNRTGCRVSVYQHVGGTGATSTWGPGANDGFLANNVVGDNRASAVNIHCR